jgi:hypothetical protein
MTYTKPEQKLISFTDNQAELEAVSNDMQNGWTIISLVRNGNYYVGIMELNSNAHLAAGSIFIPPRKRIKFLNSETAR